MLHYHQHLFCRCRFSTSWSPVIPTSCPLPHLCMCSIASSSRTGQDSKLFFMQQEIRKRVTRLPVARLPLPMRDFLLPSSTSCFTPLLPLVLHTLVAGFALLSLTPLARAAFSHSPSRLYLVFPFILRGRTLFS